MVSIAIEQKATLSRQEAARWLGELARAMAESADMEVALAGAPVTLHLAEQLRCELEVEPSGDQIELEIEFKWSASGAEGGPTDPPGPYARATR
jgi:amphi-Trp domain-containing protein